MSYSLVLMNTVPQKPLLTFSVSLLLAMGAGEAAAAGFQILEVGVKGQGVAHAGMSTRADGPETIFFNPAGMTRLPDHQVSFGLTQHFVVAEFSGRSEYSPAAGPLAGLGYQGSMVGVNGGNRSFPAMGLYATYSVSDDMKLGLGINTPFGLSSDYGDNWAGRYLAIDSELSTININPALAIRLNDRLSLGLGLNAVYAEAKLTQALDLGLLLAPLGQTPGALANDGRAKVDGDDWGYGFNFAILFEPIPGTRFGLTYRSETELSIKGSATFDTGRFPQALFGSTFDTGNSRSDLKLPQWLSAGVYHEISPGWAGMLEATWTDWSVIEELRIRYSGPVIRPDTVLPTNWSNSWRFGAGIVHTPPGSWTLRAGLAWENTPTPGPTDYIPRVPAGDGISIAVGASYELDNNLILDLAYTHIFVDALSINRTEGSHRLAGDYDGSVDIVAAQLHYIFN